MMLFKLAKNACLAYAVTVPLFNMPSYAGQAWEGIWAKTKAECEDREGPNSLTNIESGVIFNNRMISMIDQYENHCLIDKIYPNDKEFRIATTCYEFWQNAENGDEPRPEIFKLTIINKNKIKINNESYFRCE